jgi:hypothetical protein
MISEFIANIMIIDAIHRFRDTHKPQGILINIDQHWIALVISRKTNMDNGFARNLAFG